MSKLRFYRSFDVRPSLSTNLGPQIESELKDLPKHAHLVTMNLFSAVKLISNKLIHRIGVSGNVSYQDDNYDQNIAKQHAID